MTALARRAHSRSRGVARNTAVSAFRTLIRLAVGFALLPLLLHGIGSAQTGTVPVRHHADRLLHGHRSQRWIERDALRRRTPRQALGP